VKLSCADYAFPLLPHDDTLGLIATLEFSGVDIGLFENRSHLWPSKEFPQLNARARELRCKLQERDLKPADVFLQMDLDIVPYAINRPEADRRAKARDWFLRTLEYATELGSHHVTVLPGVPIDGEGREVSLNRSIAELTWRVDQSQRAGIVFAVEAHVGSIVPTPESAKHLIDAVPGLTLALDYTHFVRNGIADARAEPLIPYASNFQVRGGCDGRLQCNFAQNTIDYAEALRKLKAAGFCGWVTVEYVRTEWERCNESDNLSETILYRDFLKAQAQELGL
jgi:sugar phosphate isomerase/epimerase